MRQSRLWFVVIGVSAAAVALLYGVVILVLLVWSPPGFEAFFRPRASKPFSQTVWQTSRFGDRDRLTMANDLVKSQLLLGKTEEEVRTLLGKPSAEDSNGAAIFISYDLVPRRSFPASCALLPSFLFLNTDTWLLEIHCERGKVEETRIRST
jgi:hypothetical protein